MISIKLSDIMGKNKIKISQIEKDTGISRPTLTALYYEKSKGITFETLNRLCEYFKIDVSEIIKFEGDNNGIQ